MAAIRQPYGMIPYGGTVCMIQYHTNYGSSVSCNFAIIHPPLVLSMKTEPSLVVRSNYMAYFCVHSRAIRLNPSRSFLNFFAISGTSGSSGFGSVNSEQMDNSTFEMVSAGLH